MKGLSLEDCVERARHYIDKNGMCLLLFDVKGARYHPDRRRLVSDLKSMMYDLNTRFDEYLPVNDLGVYGEFQKGFCSLLGDGSWAGIDDHSAVSEIINYQEREYQEIKLYWGIAEDGYDREGIKIVL